MDSIKSQLMDMGFNEYKVKRAIESCPDAQNLEQVMEWLIAHEDELNTASSSDTVETQSNNGQGSAPTPAAPGEGKLDSANQQDGGPNETAANMAVRKKITVEEAQRIITERQAKRAEEDRKKAIEDEKRRRLDGQKMAETRAELQDQERIRLAQQIRREKLEKELHRKQVLEQIARDREAMKLRATTASDATSSQPAQKTSSLTDETKTTQPRAPATECRIALRFPDGSNLIQKFAPKEQLAAVKLFVQTEKAVSSPIEFVAPPNKKLNDQSMNETLESLGLCPASRLEVKYVEGVWSDLD